jgi:hypothetical protein
VPVTTISLAPHAGCSIVVVFKARNCLTDESLGGKMRGVESHINIKMLEYDDKLLAEAMYHRGRLVTYSEDTTKDGLNIPVRRLPVTARVCRSLMEVAQRNINFGTVLVNTDCSKKLFIKNMSDVPLMYRIVKTKNWVSDEFMNFSGDESLGVVKPHGQHERDFVFSPKMAGRFRETIVISNLQNPQNNVELTVKALVRKRETFALHPPSLDFGSCVSGERSRTLRIEMSNMTSQARTVVMRMFKVVFTERQRNGNSQDESPGKAPTLVWELAESAMSVQYRLEKCTVMEEKINKEEELEKLDRKLRIYIRKGKTSKIAKLKEKILALQGKVGSHDLLGPECSSMASSSTVSPEGSEESFAYSSASESEYSSDDQSDVDDARGPGRPSRSDPQLRDGQCKVVLQPKGVQTILVSISLNLRGTPAVRRQGSGEREGEDLWQRDQGSVLEGVQGSISALLVAHETVSKPVSSLRTYDRVCGCACVFSALVICVPVF